MKLTNKTNRRIASTLLFVAWAAVVIDLTICLSALAGVSLFFAVILQVTGSIDFILSSLFTALLVLAPPISASVMLRRHRDLSSISFSLLCLIITTCLGWKTYLLIDEFGGKPTAGAGLFVPTTNSVPTNYQPSKILLQHNRNGDNFYEAVWHSPESTSTFILFSENLREAYMSIAVPRRIIRSFRPTVEDFTFQDSPGKIAITELADGNMYYELIWNDQGHPLNIELHEAPKSEFPPEKVLELLTTMKRSTGGETLNFRN